MSDEELLNLAKEAAKYAYAPYSNFYVGAALLGKNDIVYTGCNIENASYGATNCAERTAIFKAISEGCREFDKIAVATLNKSCAYPCGICLQVMNEFLPDGDVILEENEQIIKYPVKKLLPYGFQL